VGIGPIQITPQMRILVAIEAVDDARASIPWLDCARRKLQADPFSGGLFVLRSGRGTSIRMLVYDSCEAPRYVEWERRECIAVESFLHSTSTAAYR
jgi:hypothetical protein